MEEFAQLALLGGLITLVILAMFNTALFATALTYWGFEGLHPSIPLIGGVVMTILQVALVAKAVG